MTTPVWSPSAERIDRARRTDFMRQVAADVPSVVDDASLYRWSVDDPAAFWRRVWDYCGVVASVEPTATVEGLDRMADPRPPGARWFPGARLNFAENLLRVAEDRDALVAWGEEGPRRRLSFGELRAEVSRLQQAFVALGVGVGDRVAGFVPNGPEAVIAMLAATSLGAVWSSCSPDFGYEGVLSRFGQIHPKVLLTADGYRFNGKPYDSLDRMARLVAAVESIEHVVVFDGLSDDPALDGLRASRPGVTVHLWDTLVEPYAAGEPHFEPLPFDHPVYVLYSSGTTGLPKCMVHGAGGTLLQHLKELVLHTDLAPEDRLFYFTTCGWMMWNWLVSGLAVGATVVLYDGSPMAPTPSSLFDLAAEERLTVFGTSAKFLALAEKHGVVPRQSHDLSALRAILSTGSPLLPESYDYVYRDVHPDVQLASISGGTDLVSCFALGNPVAPVYRGELQTRGLGMAVEVFDEDGRPVSGEKGELVCTKPFPSMPVAFWDDPDGERYHAAYFDVFPGIWRHGDWAEITPRGGLIIYGRSDATLNPGGVRLGTAEIYREVEHFEEVVEALVVGQEWDGDVRIVLFVRLQTVLISY